jgi:ParB/RepB/Spo0J family partition protein
MVPELRVTSQLDPHILDELRASISTDGILQPLQVAKVGETYVLEDGLHRLMAARELGITEAPVLVHEATEGEVLVRNLILNRQRGKSNPAQEAQVIRHLIEVEWRKVDEVSAMTGLSPGWVSRLHDLSNLPQEVLRLVEEGLLAVTAAWHLTKLEDRDLQVQTARDAANWKYTEAQVKTRVDELRGTRPPVEPGEVLFKESGEPVRIPITCCLCHRDTDHYEWLCAKCVELIFAFWQAYSAGQAQPSAPAAEVGAYAPKRMVLTDQGWR